MNTFAAKLKRLGVTDPTDPKWKPFVQDLSSAMAEHNAKQVKDLPESVQDHLWKRFQEIRDK